MKKVFCIFAVTMFLCCNAFSDFFFELKPFFGWKGTKEKSISNNFFYEEINFSVEYNNLDNLSKTFLISMLSLNAFFRYENNSNYVFGTGVHAYCMDLGFQEVISSDKNSFELYAYLRPEFNCYFSNSFGLSLRPFAGGDVKPWSSNDKGKLTAGIDLGLIYNPSRAYQIKKREKNIELQKQYRLKQQEQANEAERQRQLEIAERKRIQEEDAKRFADLYEKQKSLHSIPVLIELWMDSRGRGYDFYIKKAVEDIENILTEQYDTQEIIHDYDVSNPYAFSEGRIYSYNFIDVRQWLNAHSFLGTTNTGMKIHISDAYAFNKENSTKLKIIDKYVDNVYLKYNGVFKYNSSDGELVIAPSFDIILFF